jgi:hypothetical protein
LLLFRHPQVALDAKLALLLIHILSVAGNGYSSLQERTTTGVKMNTGKSWILLSSKKTSLSRSTIYLM